MAHIQSGSRWDGLLAQLRRSEKFRGTVDAEGAVETYLRLLHMLTPRLPELRLAAGLPQRPLLGAAVRTRVRHLAPDVRTSRVTQVYSFWDSPLTDAPPLVQACMAQLRRVHPDAQVLDLASAQELLDIPPQIVALLDLGRPAHFSDYVRTRVLEEHGGIWADATVWVPRPIEATTRGLLRGGTVFPRYARRAIANWFIASKAGSPILALQRRALEAWWETYDDVPDYFVYHRIFDVLCTLVPEFRGRWYAAPHLSATAAHYLQLAMMQPYDADLLERLMDSAPVQKLSYKYDEVLPGSVLEHLLATGR